MEYVNGYRDGVSKLREPVSEQSDGTLRNGKSILINADLIPASGLTKAEITAQIKAHKITPEIEALGMHIGDNGNGLIVRWVKDVQAEKAAKAKADYDALPTEIRAAREERMAIEDLFARSHRALTYDTDDMNVERGYKLQAEATRRIAAWRNDYPDEAKEERRRDMYAKADREDSLAVGALTYDMDGSISSEEQQKRYDEGKARAASIRTEADSL